MITETESMHWSQVLFGTLLVVVLLGLAGYYAWRQMQTSRAMRAAEETGPEERVYLRRQVWRRIFGCVLMVILAVMLSGQLLFLEGPMQDLSDHINAAQQRGEEPELTLDERNLRKFYTVWNIGLLLTLLVFLATAGVDYLSTRRFGRRQLRRIQADRRAMIERQAARLRQERNGHP
jgi:hypothetical protein